MEKQLFHFEFNQQINAAVKPYVDISLSDLNAFISIIFNPESLSNIKTQYLVFKVMKPFRLQQWMHTNKNRNGDIKRR